MSGARDEQRRLTRLLAGLAVATGVVWLLSGISPDDVARASEAEALSILAFEAGDYAASAEAGLQRLKETAVLPPGLTFRSRLADALRRSGREQRAIDVAEDALTYASELEGEDSLLVLLASNNLAWLLVLSSDRDELRLERARGLAARAVDRDEDNPYFRGTLGAAELRLGHPQVAREHLQRSRDAHLEPDARATDGLLLALALHALGETGPARAAYEQAIAAGNPYPELRAEVEGVLGLGDDPNAPAEAPPELL